jgi:hypothetical protein
VAGTFPPPEQRVPRTVAARTPWSNRAGCRSFRIHRAPGAGTLCRRTSQEDEATEPFTDETEEEGTYGILHVSDQSSDG